MCDVVYKGIDFEERSSLVIAKATHSSNDTEIYIYKPVSELKPLGQLVIISDV